MIRAFACADTEGLFHSRPALRLRNIGRVAGLRFLQIQAATELASLHIPPGNQLEAMKANRKGRQGIRIDDHWRICFAWKADGAHRVEIVNYHKEGERWPGCRTRFIRARS